MIKLAEMYFESCVLAVAYLNTRRGPKDLGNFIDDECSALLGSICYKRRMLFLNAMINCV